MPFPRLVQPYMLNATVTVSIGSETLNEDGELEPAFVAELRGNLQFKQIQKLTAKQEQVTLSGCIMFDGDICPDIQKIEGGAVEYKRQTYDIYDAQKALNPDGTVNYTRIDLK